MRVSFICASYNYQDYIGEAIQSVIDQDFTDWELIVFDDGSSDNSRMVIQKYCNKDSRVKLFCHDNNQNKGLIETLRAASKQASGEWLAFVESDDMLKKDYLSKKLEALKLYPDCALVFSGVEIMGPKNIQEGWKKAFENRNKLLKENFNIAILIKENIIPTFSCVMIKKDVFDLLDFNSPMPQNTDFWLWAQVLCKHNVLYVDNDLSIWRKHDNSYISSVNAKKMHDFVRSIFKFIFKSDLKILPKILLEAYLFFNSCFMGKFFGTPSRIIRSCILKCLYKFNKIKANIYYYNI